MREVDVPAGDTHPGSVHHLVSTTMAAHVAAHVAAAATTAAHNKPTAHGTVARARHDFADAILHPREVCNASGLQQIDGLHDGSVGTDASSSLCCQRSYARRRSWPRLVAILHVAKVADGEVLVAASGAGPRSGCAALPQVTIGAGLEVVVAALVADPAAAIAGLPLRVRGRSSGWGGPLYSHAHGHSGQGGHLAEQTDDEG
mmetsp:Transcript_54597/g.119513  ORF Transcript_54597/g.119513 Transcript_54597/m.119513 type:complete len:202 (-) Transcript_54597:105-710(-)